MSNKNEMIFNGLEENKKVVLECLKNNNDVINNHLDMDRQVVLESIKKHRESLAEVKHDTNLQEVPAEFDENLYNAINKVFSQEHSSQPSDNSYNSNDLYEKIKKENKELFEMLSESDRLFLKECAKQSKMEKELIVNFIKNPEDETLRKEFQKYMDSLPDPYDE